MNSVKQSHLPQGWRIARFDEFLHRVERKITLDDDMEYDSVGVRWYGMGTFVRERSSGIDIARKQQWLIKAGDVVYNKLFAWKGSFAIADSAVNNCIVSDKFPTYEADTEIIDPTFLGYYFRMPKLAAQAQGLSKGAAAISKLTLNPPQFWDLTIPIAPLEEQRRIVARIEEIVAKIAKAENLGRETADEVATVMTLAISRAFEGIPVDGLLSDVLMEKPRNGWSARCDNAETGVPVLSLSAITGFKYRETEYKRTSQPTTLEAHYWLREGDLLITRSNTPELVGHAAIYNGSPGPCIYPDLMMRLVLDEHHVDKRFVHYWLRSGRVRDYIGRNAKGTSSSMKKISQEIVMNIPFPSSLSISEQLPIVAGLDTVEEKVDTLRQLQAATSAGLDALLPSILDKAFKGEL